MIGIKKIIFQLKPILIEFWSSLPKIFLPVIALIDLVLKYGDTFFWLNRPGSLHRYMKIIKI